MANSPDPDLELRKLMGTIFFSSNQFLDFGLGTLWAGVWVSSVSAKIDKEFPPTETLLSSVLRDKTHFLKVAETIIHDH